ncbi:MAG: hypothetical protein ACYC1M_14155 [Armatimonadota bacterium]
MYNDVCLPCHALKHMAIGRPSLLKQAAGLRPVSVLLMQTAFSRLFG